jgi:glycosyltransferase involved in cell wall biosynthesis
MSSCWTEDVCLSTELRNPEVSFVGNFGANKNLKRLYDACKKVRQMGVPLTLNVIGSGGTEFKKVVGEDIIPGWVNVMGYIQDPEILKACYRRARVVAVPSFVETFGLVYIEALSQGASVICSRGQGVDGLIKSEFVEFIDPESVDSIANALSDLLKLASSGVPVELRKSMASDFDWRRIRNIYLESLSLDAVDDSNQQAVSVSAGKDRSG